MLHFTRFSFLLICVTSMFVFSCTKDTGTVEVQYQEASAIYGDMEEIRNTVLIAPAKEIVNPGKLFIGDNYILIGEEGEGIHVINNADRKNPSPSIFIQIPGNREYYVDNETLYAESFYDVVKIDIRNPNQPEYIDRARNAIQEEFTNAEAKTLIGFSYESKSIALNQDDDFYKEIIGDQLVYLDFAQNIIPNSAVPSSFAGNSSNQSGTVNRITKTKDHIYIISNSNMTIIPDDNSFSTNARTIKNIHEDMETIFPYKDHLFVGSRTAMSIFDIQNEMFPNEVTEFDHATSCDPVLPHKDVAYVTLRTADFSDCPGNANGLLVIDIDDVTDVDLIEEIDLSSPYGMAVIGTDLYIGEGENGLRVFDVTDHRRPEFKTKHNIEAYDIITDPNHAGIIFIAGPNGLSQFLVEGTEQSLDLQSVLLFND